MMQQNEYLKILKLTSTPLSCFICWSENDQSMVIDACRIHWLRLRIVPLVASCQPEEVVCADVRIATTDGWGRSSHHSQRWGRKSWCVWIVVVSETPQSSEKATGAATEP